MPVGKYDQERQDAIALLVACARECRMCAQACQDEDEAFPLAACIEIAQDCADLCALGADLLRRHSRFHARLSQLCAEACAECAEACSRHRDLDQCRECEEICLRCAESCHHLAGAPA